MKYILRAFAAIFLMVMFANTAWAQDFNVVKQKAITFIHHLRDSNYQAAIAMVDSTAHNYYSAQVFKDDWDELTTTYGEYKSAKPIEYQEAMGFSYIQMLINFDYLQYVLSLTLNPEYKIGYVAFTAAHSAYVPPAMANIEQYSDTTITFKSETYYEFPGILTMPKNTNPMPLVVIVAEAGPTDKDFSMGQNKPYKDLATGLATLGYAVYRYDKRTQRFAFNLMAEKNNYAKFTCREEYLDDLYNALDTLKTLPFIDKNRIFILGHGQGGMLAPLIAKERKDVKGIMMLGANAVTIQDMMAEQYDYLMTVTPDKTEEYLENKRKLQNTMPGKIKWYNLHDSMPYGIQATYFVWLNEYKHVEIAKKLKKPVLVMQFGRDYQVTNRNYELWQKIFKKNKQATFKHYPKLNHLMFEGEVQSTYSEYSMKSNIPEYVIKDIASWLDKQK